MIIFLSCTKIQCKFLEEIYNNKINDYSRLQVFGCSAYVHVFGV
uniref:Uncharacterized protein n=2 Tax=Physcomitrium patens TaxID=3218 RepID=A0A2K1JRI7_PHYPA|nr:hypothetical protein PHYPA_016532 [Physcomitrium patens]